MSPVGRTPSLEEPAATSGLSSSYGASGFLVVRSPLLPVDVLDRAKTEAKASQNDPGERGPGSNARLLKAFEDQALRDAVFFASPEVDQVLSQLRAHSDLAPKLRRSLLRYFLRASGRETPFGLLAGISLGRIGSRDCLELGPRREYRARTRISMSFLARMMTEASARPGVRDDVPHEPNSSLTEVQGDYRLAVDEPRESGGRTRFVSSVTEVRRTPTLDGVLALATAGPSLSSIASALQAGDAPFEDYLEFCRKLSDARILVPAWLPAITGREPARACAEALESQPALRGVQSLIIATSALLAEADAAVIGTSGGLYRAARLGLLAQESPADSAQPLQSVLLKPAPHLTLSNTLAARFLVAAEILQRTALEQPEPALATFRRRFAARYDRRLVPLAEALDADVGIGFGDNSYASDSLLFGVPTHRSRETSRTFDSSDRMRLRLLERALATNSLSVELDLNQLDRSSTPTVPTIESFSVMARLASGGDGRLFVVSPELTAPSAATLLARFCEVDSDLYDAVRSLAQREQALAGDTILADVAYLPSDEAANIVAHPVLRDYEIQCGGKSSAPMDRRIAISDLLVGVDGEEIRLFSRCLRKRIAIRIGSAHDYGSESLPTAYRFLGALQHQDARLVSGWSWGPLEGSPFLPRVTSGDIVLSLARWRISGPEWAPALSAEPPDVALRVRELRGLRNLPRWVTRSEGDRRLPLDLDDESCVEELLHELRKQGEMELEELFPAPGQLVLRGPEGTYAAQFVVPFERREPLPGTPLPLEVRRPSPCSTSRGYPPGSEWMYARIYAGRSRQREVLRAIQEGVVEHSLGSDFALWFYLPFADPEPHLRLRFKGSPPALREVVLARLERTLEPFLELGKVFRVELGTYEPELQRYGGPAGMELAERLFFADSEASCQLLELAGDDPDLAWQLTLVGIDRLLSDCGAGSIDRRAELALRASEGYGREVGASTATWKAIGEKYRKYSPRLTRLLWDMTGTDPVVRSLHLILAARTERIRPLWAELEATTARRGECGDGQLPLSFAHLHATRMLGVSGRAHELVLFEFLRRQYLALRAMKLQDTHDRSPATR
jgi:thiopeptide-type bacteriocin biosynthesis protein